jgi:hypothetical protein
MKQTGCVEKAEQIKWRDVLDTFVHMTWIGADDFRVDRSCRHPDAQWLLSLLPDQVELVDRDVMKRVMGAQGDDVRALFFLGVLEADSQPGKQVHTTLLRRSAESGYAPAQAHMASMVGSPEEQYAWGHKGAVQLDREGLVRTANCLLEGHGCDNEPEEKRREKAAVMLQAAIELGSCTAPLLYGTEFCSGDDWRRYHWWGLALRRGSPWAVGMLIQAAAEHVDSGSASGRILFEIGGGLRHAVNRPAFMGNGVESSAQSMKCVELYSWCGERARDAVECWLVVGRRLRASRDVRGLIARIVWEERAAWSVVSIPPG